MKKLVAMLLMLCLVLAACGGAPAEKDEVEATGVVIQPLPDTTMDNLSDAILPVSWGEGDAYLDDTGKLQLKVKIYSYDAYDMVDIAQLQVGDAIATHAGDVLVTALEKTDAGLVLINGGQEGGGFDLATNDSGIYYECGFNDAKNWYEVGEATIRVSVDFELKDNADFEAGEVIYYAGSLLIDEIKDYNFTPYNTTIRVENGQIVAMERIFMP